MESSQAHLRDISVVLKKRDLLTVVGKSGSGKTSLLYSILGETTLLKGDHHVAGKIAIIDCKPLIFNETLRKNIHCGLEYRDDRFRKAIKGS